MKLLVTGGAGYIGGVVAAKLIAAGHQVTVLDDLSTGHADAVPAEAAFLHGTLRDDAKAALGDGTDAVLHFAAKSLVGESVQYPQLYWSANLGGTLALLDAMRTPGGAPFGRDQIQRRRDLLTQTLRYANREIPRRHTPQQSRVQLQQFRH